MTNRAKKQEEDASFSLSLSLSLSDNAAGTIPLGNRLLSRLQTLQLTNSRNLFHRAVAESCGTRVSFAEEQLFVSSRGTSASRNSNQERERERERDREREYWVGMVFWNEEIFEENFRGKFSRKSRAKKTYIAYIHALQIR